MLDLLVYVNENVSCSVIIDNLEVTLDTFRREILEDQVSDVLPSHYKFTRLLNNHRIVVGLKQEAALKLSQCMQKTNNIFAVHLFHEEGINLKANEPGLNHVLSKSEDARDDDDQDQVPPRKKVRVSRQPTLFAHQPHHHPGHNQLHHIQQLEPEGSRYIVSKRSTNA